jgi:CheY-like chemotaxis protein
LYKTLKGERMSKVLIIEDMYEIRMMMRSFLIRKGHSVTDAKDGDEALQLIKRDLPDIIITDMLMPGKDGFETIREIQKNGLDLPIILVTGYNDPISQNRAIELGITKILTKPFQAHELTDAVEDSLKVSKSYSLSLS